jgi:hypothetical protein
MLRERRLAGSRRLDSEESWVSRRLRCRSEERAAVLGYFRGFLRR